MARRFLRSYEQQHLLESGHVVCCRYDRLTTRFTLALDGETIFTRLLLWPFIRKTLLVDDREYRLSVTSLFYWSSSLRGDGITLSELLPARKRDTVSRLLGALLLRTLRMAVNLVS